jgi:hypothetical protein
MKATLFSITLFLLAFINVSKAQETEDDASGKFTFEETTFDFGEVEAGTVVKHVFKFTNTGDAPLIIYNAQGSCGCTVPYFPRNPILPGESSEIQVSFNSAGRMGVNQKMVTLTANTIPNKTVLKITGQVLPPTKKEEETQEELAKRQAEQEEMAKLHPNCFAIYPNPTNNILQLDLKEFIGLSAHVTISDKMGKTLLKTKIDNINSETTVFDVSDYTPGMYLITIEMEGEKPMAQCFVVTGS